MTKVSAVLITYNEAANLRKTLGQLWWCAEIIVVDSFSTDDTIAICRKYGCKVFQRPFFGYGEQKQFAIKQASHKWVLCLDADEYLSNALIDELLKELQNLRDYDGFHIPMNLVFRGHEFKYGKESNCYFLRLFNKEKGFVTSDKVHEKFVVKGKTKKLKKPILHYSYRDTHHYFSKFNNYTSYGAQLSFKKNKKRPTLLIVVSVPLYFFKYYIIERNFLNGINGFYWAMFSACYHFVKYIKLNDLHNNHEETTELLMTGDILIPESKNSPDNSNAQVKYITRKTAMNINND